MVKFTPGVKSKALWKSKCYCGYQKSSDISIASNTMHTKICRKKLYTLLYMWEESAEFIFHTLIKQIGGSWIWTTWIITRAISTRYFGFIFTTLSCYIDRIVVISNIEFTTKLSIQINAWMMVRASFCSYIKVKI